MQRKTCAFDLFKCRIALEVKMFEVFDARISELVMSVWGTKPSEDVGRQ